MAATSDGHRRFYVTTPIYYVNDKPHIGHTYTTTAADAVARYHRMRGDEVLFVTGTDEHAQKVVRAAQAAGLDPQAFADRVMTSFLDAWDRMHISYDRFIRTTEAEHKQVVAEVFRRLLESGDIYKDHYAGWYCVPCETYFAEDALNEGSLCPDCGREVEQLTEEAYFFKASAYGNELMREIEANPERIQPDSRRNEVLSFIRQGLQDTCVTRANQGWGVPVPGDQEHVIYVWFDALINYLSAAGWSLDEEQFARTWPPSLQLMGKDILTRFHGSLWLAMLMALGIELPQMLFAHGWWVTAGGEKISKSRGNVIDPWAEVELLVEESGCTTDVAVDAVRYYMFREVTFGLDGAFSSDGLLARFNADLANDLGNLLNRTLPLVERFLDGTIDQPGPGAGELPEQIARAVARTETSFQTLDMRGMLEGIWELLAAANKFVDERAPWDLFKQGKKVELLAVLYDVVDAIRVTALMIAPVMPVVAEEIWRQIGLEAMAVPMSWDDCQPGKLPAGAQVRRGRPIFPRIDLERVRQRAAAKLQQEKTEEEEAQKMISYDDFMKVDLRIAKVLDADPVEGADKLLKLVVDAGEEEPRQVVAGLAQEFSPRELIGETVVLVANLEPATIRGVQSQGMILAAGGEKPLALIVPDRDVEPGERVR
ncbi:MAG: methionine--tRNA ligase [candidate division WS1 bacterium]|jgi:methionyl-tRNA synthetase|nr:methionine--tRNA ligase [candidate division WS1 bacterium]